MLTIEVVNVDSNDIAIEPKFLIGNQSTMITLLSEDAILQSFSGC